MESSDGVNKPWDHPWTTDEMREKRREWSLAADAGLLKHLQEFSEKLVSRVNATDEAIDFLSKQLDEAAISIDNVTNTSLALANTQFIESRVQEDDVEIQKVEETGQKDSKDENLDPVDLIATVSESVKKGLELMEEKYHNMEITDSDSEDETNSKMLSVVLLGAKDLYQDRPLPYVIGSEKWHSSNKIGLESSSSSESEQLEEEDEESDSEKKTNVIPKAFNPHNELGTRIARLSSSSSELDNSGNHDDLPYINNGKLDAFNNIDDFTSDSITPSSDTTKINTNARTPNFAEELAKRLGNVRQNQNIIPTEQSTETSNNRPNVEDKDIFNNKSENLFKENEETNETSSKLWNDKSSTQVFETKNIIPPMNDIPPPISIISAQPKSAIDDLFGDTESDDDSDDIFSSKSSVKKITKDNSPNTKDVETSNKLKPTINSPPSTITTSTPETKFNSSKLFSDEEDDDDLFPSSKKPSYNPVSPSSTKNQDSIKKKPIGGVSVFGNALASDIQTKISNRLSERRSSNSSDETSTDYEHTKKKENESNEISQNSVSQNTNDTPRNVDVSSLNIQNSSGISMRFPSINVTAGSTLGSDFEPSAASSRLKSEEFYRERIASDSLFTASSQVNPAESTFNNNSSNQQQIESSQRNETSTSSLPQDDVFDNDDLFGPPPLPESQANRKTTNKTNNSKVSSLFDDFEDSDDELFPETSFLNTKSQKSDSSKLNKNISTPTGLFDEDYPIVDIFDVGKNHSKIPSPVEDLFPSETKPNDNIISKSINLFDDKDDEDDLFGVKSIKNTGNSTEPLKATNLSPDQEEKKSIEPGMAGINESDVVDKSEEKMRSAHGLLFEDENYDDLFENKNIIDKTNDSNNNSNLDTNPSVTDGTKIEASEIKSDNKILPEESNSISEVVDELLIDKIKSPQTLSLKNSDENLQQPVRRAVSGKIKNLMGKMGEFKIISPTDATPWLTRTEKKTNEGDDSDDNTSLSKSRTPPSVSEDSTSQTLATQSTVSETSNTEGGISFDEPVQVEVLETTASKNRVRIQAKRRPQSRHARKSALRYSGIDFDTIDLGRTDSLEESDTNSENTSNKLDAAGNSSSNERIISNISIVTDDKSEYSKESSMSTNKNTLLSPSTDEEDLFDVPPDLPEDPQKEDTLFGRAPLLSPVQNLFSRQVSHNKSLQSVKEKESSNSSYDSSEVPPLTDPLHDKNHDPIKDPRALFAFVTKTPASEERKTTLFNEDDGLFSSKTRQYSEEQNIEKKDDLFTIDNVAEDDLFSVSLPKKSTKGTKEKGLFEDSDEDEIQKEDNLFSLIDSNEKSIPQIDLEKDSNLIEETENENQIEDPIEEEAKNDDDLFASKTSIIDNKKLITSNSLFPSDDEDDNDDLFGTSRSTSIPSKVEDKILDNPNRGSITVKKPVMRDLKKTAETIGEDPLSLLNDD